MFHHWEWKNTSEYVCGGSSYLQAASLQHHRVKGHACPPDFMQHRKNHLLPEQLVCLEDGGKVGEKELRCHLLQGEREQKTFASSVIFSVFSMEIYCLFHLCVALCVSLSGCCHYTTQCIPVLCRTVENISSDEVHYTAGLCLFSLD